MKNKIRLLISESVDPWFNITVEDCIFSDMAPNQAILFLWRNMDTCIIGRAQNPWVECDLKKMEELHVKLARRRSGGGAVYQDLGNSCFTFMAGKPGFSQQQSIQLIIDAMDRLGIAVEASGRNDLVVQTEEGYRKISGAAFRETADRGFYHGTMLLDVNMDRLTACLNPTKKKLKSKGIASVRSRVMNLKEIKPDINHCMFCEAVKESFFAYYGEYVEPEFISPNNLPCFPTFKENYKKQCSWEWNFGHTPQFTNTIDDRFPWGEIDIRLDISNGVINNAVIYTDALEPDFLEILSLRLRNVLFKSESIEKIFEEFPTNDMTNDVRNLLLSQIGC